MALQGDAKVAYMRAYMRKRRAALASGKGKPQQPPRGDQQQAAEIAALKAEVANLKAALASPAPNPKSFTAKGALRIEDAIRVHKERLNRAYQQQVNEEVIRRIAAADDETRKQNTAMREENLHLSLMLNQRGVFTEKQFGQLLMCVHPDNTASVNIRNEMLRLLVTSKKRLVKQR
jgi:hypothetical protein